METTPEANYARAFKPADIRGIYPTEIDATVAYQVARAFVDEFGYKTVVVGYDMRLSTPELSHAFVNGLRDAGANVIDVGMVRSPMLYFASGTLNLPGAVITASHSPKEYNGIKLVAPQAIPLTAETGLSAIKARIDSGVFKEGKKRGTYKRKSLRREYETYVLKDFDRKKTKGMTIATDIGNGMAGVSMAALDVKLPATFPMIYAKPDGRFPNRGSDPCLTENQQGLKKAIKKHKADFGVGFDGDGDRIAFLDEKGEFVNCAAIGALISTRLLEKEPKAGIVFTNLTSRIFEETIRAHKGKPVRARVGHTFLKKKMRDTGAIFGAEHSGHFFWRDFFNTDSTILTLLAVMDVYADAKVEGKTFSQMMAPYMVYEQTEDVVVEVRDKQAAMTAMVQFVTTLKPKKVTKFDGFFVDFGDVWGSVKPSVTEFAIKLMFESTSKTKAEQMQKKLLKELRAIAKTQEK